MLQQAQALAPELVRLRRDIHAHPEAGFHETRTAALVADMLHEIGGFQVRTGVGITGVVGELGTADGPVIALRADMDALPIEEATNAPYASTHPGWMHACGHDAHTAMLLGAAVLLREAFARENLKGKVRLLFQPAEESPDAENKSGAMRMIDDGALAGVDAVVAVHINSLIPTGSAVVKSGWVTANVDEFRAWITGSGAHGAYPHQGRDPIWMLGPIVQALHGIVARRVDPMQPAVVSLGQVHAGTASNIIPTEVFLHGTLRSFNTEVRELLVDEVQQALALSRALGGDYRFELKRGYPAGWNDPHITARVEEVAHALLGADGVERERAGMGAEDFAYMCQQAPGTYILLGGAIDDGITRAHHTPIFDIDERALPLGTALLAETARRYLAS